MKAMILAAGLGTRLRPLTDDRPKALVTVGGRTLLEIELEKLCAAGVTEVIVNAHHFAGMIVDYLKANGNFGIRIEVSREETLLNTGGGLRQAAVFFLENDASRQEPFLVHNVDVVSTIDLAQMIRQHRESRALVTLAVQVRKSTRALLFDGEGQLRGRAGECECECECEPLAFCGIHVLSPRIFPLIEEEGAFSIIDAYLRLAAQSEKIVAFRADEYRWCDLGRVESLREAEAEMSSTSPSPPLL